jgi:hypothetical protein
VTFFLGIRDCYWMRAPEGLLKQAVTQFGEGEL